MARIEVQEPSTLVPEPEPLHRTSNSNWQATRRNCKPSPDSLLNPKYEADARSVYPNFKSPPDYLPAESWQQSQFIVPAKQKAAASPNRPFSALLCFVWLGVQPRAQPVANQRPPPSLGCVGGTS
nr:hypothetical protein [Trichoderma harzianum]